MPQISADFAKLYDRLLKPVHSPAHRKHFETRWTNFNNPAHLMCCQIRTKITGILRGDPQCSLLVSCLQSFLEYLSKVSSLCTLWRRMGKWRFNSRSGHFNPMGRAPGSPLNRRRVVPQRQSEGFVEATNLLPLSGIDPWYLGNLACNLFTVQTTRGRRTLWRRKCGKNEVETPTHYHIVGATCGTSGVKQLSCYLYVSSVCTLNIRSCLRDTQEVCRYLSMSPLTTGSCYPY